MAIKHAFVSGKPDSADPTIASSSEWNDNHVIDNATITLAHLANLGNQRAIGRKTAGAGVPEEVTASELLDWISNANVDGKLLCRAAGLWRAMGRVATDAAGNDLFLTTSTDPGAPGATQIRIHGEANAGRNMLRVAPGHVSVADTPWAVQPFIAEKNIQILQAVGGGDPEVSRYGTQLPWIGGTATARVWGASYFASRKRLGYVSAAGAGSIAYIRQEAQTWRGNAAGLGGFHFVARFGISDAVLVGTANMFVGLGANAAPGDVGPQTLTNIVGVGCTNGDTQLQLYAAGAAAQARTALGANFPCNTVSTDLYEVQFFCPPNGDRLEYQLTRLNTGHVATGEITAGAALFANNISRSPQIWRSNGGTASAVAFDLVQMYVESPV